MYEENIQKWLRPGVEACSMLATLTYWIAAWSTPSLAPPRLSIAIVFLLMCIGTEVIMALLRARNDFDDIDTGVFGDMLFGACASGCLHWSMAARITWSAWASLPAFVLGGGVLIAVIFLGIRATMAYFSNTYTGRIKELSMISLTAPIACALLVYHVVLALFGGQLPYPYQSLAFVVVCLITHALNHWLDTNSATTDYAPLIADIILGGNSGWLLYWALAGHISLPPWIAIPALAIGGAIIVFALRSAVEFVASSFNSGLATMLGLLSSLLVLMVSILIKLPHGLLLPLAVIAWLISAIGFVLFASSKTRTFKQWGMSRTRYWPVFGSVSFYMRYIDQLEQQEQQELRRTKLFLGLAVVLGLLPVHFIALPLLPETLHTFIVTAEVITLVVFLGQLTLSAKGTRS